MCLFQEEKCLEEVIFLWNCNNKGLDPRLLTEGSKMKYCITRIVFRILVVKIESCHSIAKAIRDSPLLTEEDYQLLYFVLLKPHPQEVTFLMTLIFTILIFSFSFRMCLKSNLRCLQQKGGIEKSYVVHLCMSVCAPIQCPSCCASCTIGCVFHPIPLHYVDSSGCCCVAVYAVPQHSISESNSKSALCEYITIELCSLHEHSYCSYCLRMYV